MDLEGRVAVITGGGSGIGEALAGAVARAGAAHVVVADIDEDQAQRVAAVVGGTAAGTDVRNETAVRALVELTEDAHGPIGLFASNAGYVTAGGLEDSNERIQAMWEVHVMAHIYAARAVLPQMIANGSGYLLNTASAAGLLAQIGSLSYSVTKHAAISLAEWLAITHHHQGIRVSVLCPQAVRTNILENSPDAAIAEWDGFDASVAGQDGVVEPAGHIPRWPTTPFVRQRT
jgi:NAD(P)-dependent dehydrogenase (short-subunit alcohol dehydrogenase family)